MSSFSRLFGVFVFAIIFTSTLSTENINLPEESCKISDPSTSTESCVKNDPSEISDSPRLHIVENKEAGVSSKSVDVRTYCENLGGVLFREKCYFVMWNSDSDIASSMFLCRYEFHPLSRNAIPETLEEWKFILHLISRAEVEKKRAVQVGFRLGFPVFHASKSGHILPDPRDGKFSYNPLRKYDNSIHSGFINWKQQPASAPLDLDEHSLKYHKHLVVAKKADHYRWSLGKVGHVNKNEDISVCQIQGLELMEEFPKKAGDIKPFEPSEICEDKTFPSDYCSPAGASDSESESGKVFLIGFEKTGTSSLFHLFFDSGVYSVHWYSQILASTILSNFYHRRKLLTGLEEYQAYFTMDSLPWNRPNILFYKLLDIQYPNSKFIFSTRPYENFIKSRMNWNYPMSQSIARAFNLSSVDDLPDQHYAPLWESHRRDVEEYFRGREQDLLVFDIESDDVSKVVEFFPKLNLDASKWGHYNRSKK